MEEGALAHVAVSWGSAASTIPVLRVLWSWMGSCGCWVPAVGWQQGHGDGKSNEDFCPKVMVFQLLGQTAP